MCFWHRTFVHPIMSAFELQNYNPIYCAHARLITFWSRRQSSQQCMVVVSLCIIRLKTKAHRWLQTLSACRTHTYGIIDVPRTHRACCRSFMLGKRCICWCCNTRSPRHAGLKPGAVAREALQEGLLVFCPWLAEDGLSDADAASTDSWELGGMDTLDAGSGALSEVRAASRHRDAIILPAALQFQSRYKAGACLVPSQPALSLLSFTNLSSVVTMPMDKVFRLNTTSGI